MIATAQHTNPNTAALRARLAGSKISELIGYSRSALTDRQLRDAFECAFNMTRAAVQFARVAIEAARPVVPPRAYTCVDCKREQDIPGNCITCGLPVVATIGRAA